MMIMTILNILNILKRIFLRGGGLPLPLGSPVSEKWSSAPGLLLRGKALPTRGKVGHQREIPCGPEGRHEEVQFGGLRRKGNMWGGASIPHTLP